MSGKAKPRQSQSEPNTAETTPVSPLGPYLASIRQVRRLTLREVEQATGGAVSNAYLSQLEKDERPVTPELARSAMTLYRLSATALPLPQSAHPEEGNPDRLARQLAALGYPGFAHLRGRRANPAAGNRRM